MIETVGTYKGQHAKTEADGATKFQRALKVVCAVTHYKPIVSNHLNKIVQRVKAVRRKHGQGEEHLIYSTIFQIKKEN